MMTLTIVLVFIVLGLFVGFLLFLFVFMSRGLSKWSDNNHSPIVTVEATVVDKMVERRINPDGPDRTWANAMFQFPDGQRRQYAVDGRDYAQLAVGDHGLLTFQGTRFKGFSRAMPGYGTGPALPPQDGFSSSLGYTAGYPQWGANPMQQPGQIRRREDFGYQQGRD